MLLPRFTNGVEVTVNGVIVHDSRRDPAANRPDRNTPEIAEIPAPILRDGVNDLRSACSCGARSRVFSTASGPARIEARGPITTCGRSCSVTLPVVFSAWQAILAVILGIMWVMRRHEPAYGVLAAAMATGFRRLFCRHRWERHRFPG